MKNTVKNFSLGIALFFCISALHADEGVSSGTIDWSMLEAYDAKFEVFRGNSSYGTASRKLEKIEEQWKLTTYSKLSLLFLSFVTKESSLFDLSENYVRPIEYSTHNEASIRKARYSISNFDWEAKKESGKSQERNWERELTSAVYDRNSHVIQLRFDVARNVEQYLYPIAYNGETKDYQYFLEGEETLTVPYGDIKALKFRRETDNKNRTFHVWLAPELDYFPIQIQQQKKGDKPITLKLKGLTFTEKG